jgi:cbb3-type cytochrome oxidase subunit 3
MHFLSSLILWLQLHSVIAMIVVFSLLVITTYWPGRRAEIERNGMIPLQDDR